MASRILAKRKVIAYMPNLTAAVKHFSTFNYVDKVVSQPINLSSKSLASETTQAALTNESITISKNVPTSLNETLLKPQNSGINVDVLNQFYEKKLQIEEQTSLDFELKPSTMDNLECLAVDCTEGMKKDFKGLFMYRDIQLEATLSVITLSQKTINDMSSWSPDVEDEREALLEHFIEGAKDICTAIQKAGYWADFVDPESGRPFYSAYTTDTLFETDYRYKKLGFEINDLGCCKVIVHSVWGVNVYVGSLFTNAPIDHPVITKLTQYMKNYVKSE